MGAGPQKSSMVGRNEDAPITGFRQCVQQRANDVLIDGFQGFHFGIGLAFVRRLVRRLNVDANQVVVLQGGDGRTALGGIIGVEISRGSRHVDAFPAEQHADAANQIHGADDCPSLPYIFANGCNCGARPWPHSQICVAARLPFATRCRLTGWSASTARLRSIRTRNSRSCPAPWANVGGSADPECRAVVGFSFVPRTAPRCRRPEYQHISVADARVELNPSPEFSHSAERVLNRLIERPASSRNRCDRP